MLKEEEIQALKNKSKAHVNSRVAKVPQEDWFKKGKDPYYDIRHKKKPLELDMRRFLVKYDPPKTKMNTNSGIDNVYRVAEYLRYVEFMSTPDMDKEEIFGFSTTTDFASHYDVDVQTLYKWRCKEAFKKRVIERIQREATARAANVTKIWYDKFINSPEKCTAADFEKFLSLCGLTVNKSEKTVNNNFTAIQWKTKEMKDDNIMEGEVVEDDDKYIEYEG